MTNQKGMEMPIQVMIVFFVAIAVALIVINFAGQMIKVGETQMREFKLDCTDEADFFIETKTATSNTIATLADRCYKDNRGTYKGDTICFIVHVLDAPGFANQEVTTKFLQLNPGYDPTKMGEPIKFDAWTGQGKTIYIKFNELAQNVSIAS